MARDEVAVEEALVAAEEALVAVRDAEVAGVKVEAEMCTYIPHTCHPKHALPGTGSLSKCQYTCR